MDPLLVRTASAACMAAAWLLCAGDATAALYKWTDANGRIVYSDPPPPTNVKSELLQPPPPPANPRGAKEMATKGLEYRQRQLEKTEAGAKADKDRASAKALADSCTATKGQMQQLGEGNMVLYRINEKGERVAMDDAARRAERERLGKWLRENCPG